MTKARTVLCLQLGLGGLGTGVAALALVVGLGRVRWDLPSAGALLQACQTLVLPDLDAASVLTLALAGLGFAVMALSGWSALRRLRASRRVMGRIRVITQRYIAGTSVTVFDDGSVLAFCAGLLRPRVYLSRGSLEQLRDDELEAVVAHERHHLRQRDPLRIFVAQVLGDGLFFAPALRRLADRYAALAELAADRATVRANGGDPAALASALLAFERSDPAVVGIAPERVDQLLGDSARWGLPLALTAWALAVIVAVAALALRVDAATQADVNLPVLVAQSCMLLMAVLPAVIVAGSLLGARRLLHRVR